MGETNHQKKPETTPVTILLMVQKSCTSWDVYNPVNNGIFTISTGDRRISPINSSTGTFFRRFSLPVQHRFACSRRRFRGCVWLVILYLFFTMVKITIVHRQFGSIFGYLFPSNFLKSKCFLSSSHDLYQMKVNILGGGFN